MKIIDADKIDFNELTKGNVEFTNNEIKALKKLIEAQPSMVPCEIGETVYWVDLIGQVNKITVEGFSFGIIDKNGNSPIGCFGCNIFTTIEEAEEAKRKMKNK